MSFALYNECAIEHMKKMIEDGIKVDLIVTDPPYKTTKRGIGKNTNSGGMMIDDLTCKGKVFEHNSIELEDWINLAFDVLKDDSHCYIMTNSKNLPHYLSILTNETKFKTEFKYIKTMVWNKGNKVMNPFYMNQVEFIIFLRKGKAKKINNCGTSDLFDFPNKKTKADNGKAIHPTEKPVDLMEQLILNSTNMCSLIFDPFVGIGSVGVASVTNFRDFVGCEIDTYYHDVAYNNVLEAMNNLSRHKCQECGEYIKEHFKGTYYCKCESV